MPHLCLCLARACVHEGAKARPLQLVLWVSRQSCQRWQRTRRRILSVFVTTCCLPALAPHPVRAPSSHIQPIPSVSTTHVCNLSHTKARTCTPVCTHPQHSLKKKNKSGVEMVTVPRLNKSGVEMVTVPRLTRRCEEVRPVIVHQAGSVHQTMRNQHLR